MQCHSMQNCIIFGILTSLSQNMTLPSVAAKQANKDKVDKHKKV